ncbi:hypothetical protein DFP72DRAFT_1061320 [Ephemerocybe angulata]|uniref:Uncharacterized protein n=1 Tax=Ephemerocybe angulata TaxID=980116 RepID=A0A8H6MEE6_9AGAR|nr:hypothetical protein DFP72DRAFT_1061320 [Tulosesus angulatus]
MSPSNRDLVQDICGPHRVIRGPGPSPVDWDYLRLSLLEGSSDGFPAPVDNPPFYQPGIYGARSLSNERALLSISHEFEPESPGDHDAVTQLILAHTARLRCIDLSSVEVCNAPSLGDDHLLLKRLSLQRRLMSWEALPLSEGLTDLCLVLDEKIFRFLYIPSLEELLVSLRGLGFLRRLELSRYLSFRPGDRALEEPPTTLPALQEIYLKDSSPQVNNFLECIQIPNVALVDITLLDMHSVRYAPQFFMDPQDLVERWRTIAPIRSFDSSK